MIWRMVILFILLFPGYGFTLQDSSLVNMLYTESGWRLVEIRDDGVALTEKEIPDLPIKAVCVSQVATVDPEILAQVIEDLNNYSQFLKSASAMECRILEEYDAGLVGYQHLDVPLLANRHYVFRMFRPEPDQSRVDWVLVPFEELAILSEGDAIAKNSGVYLETGVGSWSMKDLGNGEYEISYRLVMDPGGWIPGKLTDMINRKFIVEIFQDGLAEAKRRGGDIGG